MSEGYIESIDNVKSKTISIVRAIAMLSIVICHYVQCYENISWMGQFFNVGVSMFFLISGVLHGQKQIKNKMSWYKRKLLKILIPVYITLLW